MPGSFSFASDNPQFAIDGDEVLFQTILSRGSGSGVNNVNRFSAIAKGSIDGTGDVDIFAIHLIAGQQFDFDIDDGAGDSSSVDVQLDIINSRGALVASNDDGGVLDTGSVSTLDSALSFTATQTGTYYVAVHQYTNDYNDGGFSFNTTGAGAGDYSVVVSTAKQPSLLTMTNSSEVRSFSNSGQRVNALGGNDTVTLNGGNDIAAGGNGADTLKGGAGQDILYGDRQNDRLEGGIGNDALYGGLDDDTLIGGTGEDELNGGEGDDDLQGDDGNDTLWGDSGDDTINGGAGNDFIRGGLGQDTMTGGSGADTFHFLLSPINEAPFNPFGGDGITDFSGSGLSGDRIDLSDVFAGTLTYRGYGAFTNTAGEVRIQDFRDPGTGAGNQQVRIDVNGDGTADMGIVVDYQGSFNFQSGDFIL